MKEIVFRVPIVGPLLRRCVFLYMAMRDPRVSANISYRAVFHKDIDWENPKDLIEKIYWLQLFSDTTLWTQCADKYGVRYYVEKKGLSYLLPVNYCCWGGG